MKLRSESLVLVLAGISTFFVIVSATVVVRPRVAEWHHAQQIRRDIESVVGSPLPLISAISLNEDTLMIPRAGHVTVVAAFSTTCPYCERNLPDLKDVIHACTVEMYLLSKEPVHVLQSYWNRVGWPSDTARGSVKLASLINPDDFARSLHMRGTPDYAISDYTGRIVHRVFGLTRYDEFVAYIRSAGSQTCTDL